MKPFCIYHGKCVDGFTAAWAVWKALGDVEFHEGNYGAPPPDVINRDVIIVDFSYKRPVLEEMAAKCHTMVILDHHKTAMEDLKGFPEPGTTYSIGEMLRYQQDNNAPIAVHALFDIERSGAGITWDFFCPRKNRPALINYVEDRDLWRFKLPDSRSVNAYISAFNFSLTNWDSIAFDLELPISYEEAKNIGTTLIRKHDMDVVEMVAATKRSMTIGGHVVPVANVPFTMTSDAGNLLGQGVPFAATYCDTPHGRVFSLRSSRGGLDVAEIAQKYGGGGHEHAAGFKKPLGWEGDLS